METLYTDRLILRPWKEEDLADFFAYARDERVGPAAGWRPHKNLSESRKVLRRLIREKQSWAIVLKDSQRAIGSIGLYPDGWREEAPYSRELGYGLAEPFWGQGLAGEATQAVLSFGFNELGLELVACAHFPENLRSRRVIEKSGFHFEGILRKGYQNFDGSIQDLWMYSMTYQEAAQRSQPAANASSSKSVILP